MAWYRAVVRRVVIADGAPSRRTRRTLPTSDAVRMHAKQRDRVEDRKTSYEHAMAIQPVRNIALVSAYAVL
jgi:hypothetical protein